jgi:hypothetical protein
MDYKIDLNYIPVDRERLMQVLGAEDPAFVSYMNSEIDRYLDILKGKLFVRGGYILFTGIDFSEKNKIGFGDQIFTTEKIVYGMLKNSELISVFACTAGPQIEYQSKVLRESGDAFGEYIINALGSLIVEHGMDIIHEHLQNQAQKENLKITNRYSPGYCNWDVSEQQKLFTLLPEEFCGITLTQSSLMQPIKSVSGFIGIGKNVKFNSYTCDFCSSTDCIYRKIRTVKSVS